MALAKGNENLAQDIWDSLGEHLRSRIFEVAGKTREGTKVVGVFPGDWVPEEIIHAAGAIPLGLIHGGEPEPVEASHGIVPRFLCAFARAACGYGLLGDRPYYEIPNLFVTPISCQSLRRVADVYSYHFDADVFKLGVPHRPERDGHVEHFKGTLQELVRKLEQITGGSLGDLRGSIDLYNKMRSALKKLSLMRKALRPPITTKEFIRLNHASMFADPEFMVEILESLVERLQGKEGANQGMRLMITGPNIAHGDWKVLDLIEELGAQVVIEEVVEGMRYYGRNIKTDGDLIGNLAEGYLRDRRPWPFAVGSMRPRSDSLFDMTGEFDVNGIIWYQLKYCECYDFECYYNAEKAGERGIPFLRLLSEYELIDKGAVKTRIEAFLETL